MNWVDYTILGIIGLSALVSTLRGFFKEAFSLLGWVLAFWVALTYTSPLAAHLSGLISIPSVRLGAAFFVLFVVTLLVVTLVNFLIGQLIEKTGITATDRLLGVVFGVARGVIIVAVIVLLAGLTTLPQEPWWRESSLIAHFQVIAMELRKLLPPGIASYFSY
ncbi:MAG: CvpA family protein [Gammaproteobacteria bacterium]